VTERPPTRWIRLGGALFRVRSWTPVPLLVGALAVARPAAGTLIAGLALAVVGEAIRMAAVAHIGARSRTRGDGVGPLVTHGPFAHCRNPLYLGNLLMAAGLALGTGVPALAALTVVLVGAQYRAIVAWEERQLVGAHGEAYRAYCAAVPRFLPWRAPPSTVVPGLRAPWTRVLRAERSTLVVHLLSWAALAGIGLLRGSL
jgi:protein-S-isoprenylcysteine O-methyltransferase Ste14